jgi:hypothetical protein
LLCVPQISDMFRKSQERLCSVRRRCRDEMARVVCI